MQVRSCPPVAWVPLVESGDYLNNTVADPVIRKQLVELLAQNDDIDTILLACTHYPLLYPRIRAMLPPDIDVVTQGEIVAESLVAYMKRHPEMQQRLSKAGKVSFFTTGNTDQFEQGATLFWGAKVKAVHVELP